MKIIYNKILPFKGFGLINFLGLVFSRIPEDCISWIVKQHEQIHTEQQEEILAVGAILSLVLCNIFASWWYLLGVIVVPFLVYFLSFLVEVCIPPYHNVKIEFHKEDNWLEKLGKIVQAIKQIWVDAYHDNCFEREAYANEANPNYFVNRKRFAWIRYALKKSQRNG